MSRAVILSLVLVFVAAPHASQFCIAWCDNVAAQVPHCHHDESQPALSVERHAQCGSLTFATAAFVREDTRQSPRGSTAQIDTPARISSPDAASRCVFALVPHGPRVITPLRSSVLRL